MESGIIYSGKFTVHANDKRRHSVSIVHIGVCCWKTIDVVFFIFEEYAHVVI